MASFTCAIYHEDIEFWRLNHIRHSCFKHLSYFKNSTSAAGQILCSFGLDMFHQLWFPRNFCADHPLRGQRYTHHEYFPVIASTGLQEKGQWRKLGAYLRALTSGLEKNYPLQTLVQRNFHLLFSNVQTCTARNLTYEDMAVFGKGYAKRFFHLSWSCLNP
jgi:hypothetical protein